MFRLQSIYVSFAKHVCFVVKACMLLNKDDTVFFLKICKQLKKFCTIFGEVKASYNLEGRKPEIVFSE